MLRMLRSLHSRASRSAIRRWTRALLAAAFGFGGNASAILLDRGPDMLYDTALDITWTRQAGEGVLRNWADANAWAAALSFAGFDDWRLPYASVNAGAGPTNSLYICTGAGGADEVACRDSEMAYMFYYNLDGNFEDNKTGTQTAVGGEVLTGIQPFHWSGTEFNFSSAFFFFFDFGGQGLGFKSDTLSGWAVRAGDVCDARPELCSNASVMEPATLALFGIALAGLGFSRRKRAN